MQNRPLITFALLTYNQERFVEEAVQAAFAQTYSPVELILSDDKSTDRTWDMLRRMAEEYKGPHRIILNQNPANLGLGSHVNAIMKLARGELIVIAAGDDVSNAKRADLIYRAWERSDRRAMSLTSYIKKIDHTGREIGEFKGRIDPASKRLVHRARHGCWNVQGCSHAWHRKVFEVFGPLQDYVVAEDRSIEFRSLALGEVVVVDDYLVQYRVHDSNLAAISHNATTEERLRNSIKLNLIHTSMFRQFLVDLKLIESLGLCAAQEVRKSRTIINSNLTRLSFEKDYLISSPKRRLILALKVGILVSPATGLRWILRLAASH